MKKSTSEKYAGSLLGQRDFQKGRIRKWDYIIMAVITLVYAAVALTNLGSMDAPHSAWRNAPVSESVVIDLGAPKEIASLWHFDGIAKGEIAMQYSDDGKTWSDGQAIELKEGEMYKWQKISLDISARYIRLSPEQSNLWVNELALWDKQGNLLQAAQVTPEAGNALFDEQAIVPAHPTYMNEMYFDEIYHGRTALEHIEQINPYENTHPPLGKVIIAAGIELFGMDPFGWRFSGTVFGILMVPVIYILAKRILRETKYASLATVLFTFDFMHFTQTRIATIDTYGVIFILLMYYFMYRYYEMSFYRERLGKTLTMLGLSGLMFGIGSACKWIDLYAGVGLAIILVLSLWRRWREYQYSKLNVSTAEGENKAVMEHAINVFAKYTCITLAYSIVLFIIIPSMIYFLAYFPYMMVKGSPKELMPDFIRSCIWIAAYAVLSLGTLFFLTIRKRTSWVTLLCAIGVCLLVPIVVGTATFIQSRSSGTVATDLKTVWDWQKYMFNYHSTLTARHPYESIWITWILDARPIWFYYQSDTGIPGAISSISSFGNPVVWWAGTAAAFFCIFSVFRRQGEERRMLVFVLIGLAAQFIPWVFITRATFIYHYFASVPFVILLAAYCVRRIETRYPRAKWLTYAFMGVAILLFALFYPILSGVPAQKNYFSDVLRWLPSWVFFL